jgi:cytochrome c biogenesis protein CcmG/thiol:disulfide interchange protein DsbE
MSQLRFLVPLGAFVLLAALLALGLKHAPEKGVVISPLVGRPAPEFSLPALGDPSMQVSTADLRGKWYLLNVWGTWCVACAEEHSMLLTVASSGAVPLIGMDWRDEEGDARKWLSERGNPYAVVAVDRDGREAVNWGVTAAPESFLVNPAGIIVYKCTGEITPQVWQNEILPRIAGKKEGTGQVGGVRDAG